MDQQGVVAEGLITTYDRLRESQESQSRVTEEIDDLLTNLAEAARHIEEAGQGATPLLTNLRDASEQVAQAAGSIEDLQAETIRKVSETAPAIESLRGSFERVESELASLAPISERLSELDTSADNVAMSLHGVSERMGSMESTLEDMSKTFSSEGHDLRRAMSTLGSELTEASTTLVQQPPQPNRSGSDDDDRGDSLDFGDDNLNTPLGTSDLDEEEEPALEADPVPSPTVAPAKSEFTTLVARAESTEAEAASPHFDGDAPASIEAPVQREAVRSQESVMEALAAPIDDPETEANGGLATPGSGFAGLLSRYRSSDGAPPVVPEAELSRENEPSQGESTTPALEAPPQMQEASAASDDRSDGAARIPSTLDESESPVANEASSVPTTDPTEDAAAEASEDPSAVQDESPSFAAEDEAPTASETSTVAKDSSESKLLTDTDYAATAYSTVQRRKEKVSVRTRKRKSRKGKKAQSATKAKTEASAEEAAGAVSEQTASDEEGQKEARLSRFFGED